MGHDLLGLVVKLCSHNVIWLCVLPKSVCVVYSACGIVYATLGFLYLGEMALKAFLLLPVIVASHMVMR